LFEHGRVVAVNGNEADVLVGYDARNNALELKGVPIASGYVPRVGDWVAIGYEAGNSGAPWVTGPSMPAEASEDPPGIGVFSVCSEEPAEAAASTVYFDEGRAVWRGFDGAQWVDFCDSVHPSAHNSLPDLQGGAAGQYYHLTAAEYAGSWAHLLVASDDDVIPVQGYRTTSHTNEYASALFAEHRTSGDMADGFAVGILFALEDATSGGQAVGRFAAVRAGADNTADFVWWPATAGLFNERMRLTAAGALSISAGLTATGASLTGLTNTRVVFAGAGGVLSGAAGLTWDGTYLVANSIKDSALTATRIIFAGAAGLLSDDANFVWSGGQLFATASGVAAYLIRSDAATNTFATELVLRHTTSADMVDGFGARMGFTIQDSAGVENVAGYMGAMRAGGDTTSDLYFQAYAAGAAVDVMRMMHTGDIAIANTKQILLDGVAGTGHTSIRESADNVITLKANNVDQWSVSTAALYPPTDNAQDLGTSALFPKDVYGYRHIAKAGSAALPSFTFGDDLNTGLYRIGNDVIGFSAGGTGRWGISTTALYPIADNAQAAGTSALGITALYLSDANTTNPSAEGEVRVNSASEALQHYIGGAIHYNGSGLYAGPTTTETATGSGVKAETAFTNKFTVPGALWAAGKVIRIRAYVYATVSGTSLNGTVVFKLYVGGTGGIYLINGGWAYSAAQNHNSLMQADVLVNTRGSSGTVTCLGLSWGWSAAGSIDSTVAIGNQTGMLRDSSTKTLNTTANQDIVVTYQVSGATPGSWTVALKELVVETIK
jgi:hypothetical protein